MNRPRPDARRHAARPRVSGRVEVLVQLAGRIARAVAEAGRARACGWPAGRV